MHFLLKNAFALDASGQKVPIFVLTDGRIIAKVSQTSFQAAAQEIDLDGCTLMSGFTNTHVHLMDCHDGFNDGKLRKHLLSGVTTVRDQGILSYHPTEDALRWRERILYDARMPRLYFCGKFISAKNGYGGVSPYEVSSEAEARDAVKRLRDGGADHIKTSLDEGYDDYTQTLGRLTLPLLAAICDEAHKLSLKVSAHVNRAENLRILVEAGIDEAAHGCFDRIPDDLLVEMAENRIAMTPTLSVYAKISNLWGAPFLNTAMDNVRRFHALGGIIGLGNDAIEEDALYAPAGMPMLEIELLGKAGLPMRDVIRAATEGGAAIIGDRRLGRITEECFADLIGVRGNPCEIPYLLSHVDFVMKDGIPVRQPANL